MASRVRVSILAVAFAVIVAFPAIAGAQATTDFGVKVGAQSTDVTFGDSTEGADRKFGLLAGPYVGRKINDKWGWQAAALFLQMGAKDSSAKIKLNYVGVPFTLHYMNESSSGMMFCIFAGPQINFKINAEITEGGQTEDLDDEVKSTDVGARGGVGVGKGRWMFDLSYFHGFTNIEKNGSGGSIKNNAIAGTLTIKLNK